MMDAISLFVVLLAGLYLLVLGAASLFIPARASRFLLGFAGSAGTHYLELLVRMAVGGAFIWCAPRMLFPTAFTLFGWVLVVTTAGLLLVPWQWHRRFAQRTVPNALRYIALIGISSLTLGVMIWVALFLGNR